MEETTVTLAHSETDGYEIALRRRTNGPTQSDELIVNGVFTMDSAHIDSEIALAEALGPHPGHVLVGGLGLGFTAAHLLAMGATSIDIVELAAPLLQWAHQGLTPTLASLAASPQVSLRQGDVAELLCAQPSLPGLFGPWDAIYLDIDNGPDFLVHPGNAQLYTRAGMAATLNHLNPGGGVAIWSQGPSKRFWYDLATLDPDATERLIPVKRGNRKMDYAVYVIHAAASVK